MVNPGGSISASASWATAGSSRRLVRSPEAPKRTKRSIMGLRPSRLAVEFCVARRGRSRHSGAATENRARQRFVGATLAVVPGRRDVEIAAVVAAKRHRGRIRRRQLDHAVEGAVGVVAVHGPRSSQGDPQHALVVDGHAVRPELSRLKSRNRRRPVREPVATSRSKASTTHRAVSAR